MIAPFFMEKEEPTFFKLNQSKINFSRHLTIYKVLVFIFLQAKNGQPYPLVLTKIACGDIDD